MAEITQEELDQYITDQAEAERVKHVAEYSDLKNELENDSQDLKFLTGLAEPENTQNQEDNQKIANLLSDTSKGGGIINRNSVGFTEIYNSIDIIEFAVLTVKQRDAFLALYSDRIVNLNDKAIWTSLTNLFGAESKTITALALLKTRQASRAELLGYNNLKYWDVARARRINIG